MDIAVQRCSDEVKQRQYSCFERRFRKIFAVVFRNFIEHGIKRNN